MKGKYRIYALNLPTDVKERVSEIHASSIMNPKNEGIVHTHNQSLKGRIGKEINSTVEKLRK